MEYFVEFNLLYVDVILIPKYGCRIRYNLKMWCFSFVGLLLR